MDNCERCWLSARAGRDAGRPGLTTILDAIVSLLGADMGNVQLLNPITRKLEITTQRGFRRRNACGVRFDVKCAPRASA
jgi:hypothetical protein